MTRSFDKLNFFYATTGSLLKLQKMQGVTSKVGDPMLRFDSATLNANAVEKVKVLAEAGQAPLAYLAARVNGVEDYSKVLEKTLIESEEYDHERIFAEADAMVKRGKGARTLLPCRPIFANDSRGMHESGWQMTNMRAKEAERAAEVFR